MPPRARKAALDSVEGIAEDLLFARESLGIDRADRKRLAATVRQMGVRGTSSEPDDLDDEGRLTTARALLKRCVVDVCVVHEFDHRNDVCEVAAAGSLSDLLVPDDPTHTTKANVVRRKHLQAHGCHMTPDGLRKREDRLIPVIADAVSNEIYESLASRWNLNAILAGISVDARVLAAKIRELMRKVYGVDDFSDDHDAMWLAQRVHLALAHTHAGCQGILLCLTEPRERSCGDLWFAYCAYNILTLPFDRLTDRRILAEVYKSIPAGDDIEAFMANLAAHPERMNHLVGWERALTGCSNACEFERSNDRTRMCRMHQLALALDELVDSYDEAQQRTLNRSLRDRFGAAIDYLE